MRNSHDLQQIVEASTLPPMKNHKLGKGDEAKKKWGELIMDMYIYIEIDIDIDTDTDIDIDI